MKNKVSHFLIGSVALAFMILGSIEEPIPEPTEEPIEDIIHWKQEEVTEVTIEPLEVEMVEQPSLESLGEFKLTAYCPCKKCSGNWGTQTSTGGTTVQGRTVAVDPSVIPYGTVLIINGHEYIADDCGGAIKGNRIDIYFDSHEEALEFGVQYTEVFVEGGVVNGY